MGWFSSKQPLPLISPRLVCEFLLYMFNLGSSSSSLNSMRSAINFFTLNKFDLDNNIFIKRIFKYFYRERPLKCKYSSFSDVDKLLDFLKTWHPMTSLSLKQLTLKTIALIALSSSDRGQTLHLASTGSMEILPDKVIFVIRERVKNTRKTLKPTIINCPVSDVESLNVAAYVKYYIDVTNDFREEGGQLFISWASKSPVSKQSLARWLTQILSMAGIDTNTFKAHSFRGAGLTKAYQRGASLEQIVEAGNWSSSSTFKRFYFAPSIPSVGSLILQ